MGRGEAADKADGATGGGSVNSYRCPAFFVLRKFYRQGRGRYEDNMPLSSFISLGRLPTLTFHFVICDDDIFSCG